MLGVDARVPDDRNGGRFSRRWPASRTGTACRAGSGSRRASRRATRFISPTSAVQTSLRPQDGTSCRQRRTVAGRRQRPLSRLHPDRAAANGRALIDRCSAGPVRGDARRSRRPTVVAGRAQPVRSRRRTPRGDGAASTRSRASIGFRRFRGEGRAASAQRRAVLHVRRPRSGLASRGGMPPAERSSFSNSASCNAKAMGLNTLRCHVKIPDRLYFDLADRLGLIVWLDMPYMAIPRARRRARRCAGCSGRRSRRTGFIPRSASGRCSTRAGASISTTIRTTGAG